MVEFEDHAILAQLGAPDMRTPISYALSYPERWETDAPRVDFFDLGTLSFEAPDTQVFSCLRLAREAMRAGGSYPVALNAANETLVRLFLEERIPFLAIQETLARVLADHRPVSARSLEEVLETDRAVRAQTMRAAV
jgi:1-deoxy-D-xylulose-5-phosphate reductoisomerase